MVKYKEKNFIDSSSIATEFGSLVHSIEEDIATAIQTSQSINYTGLKNRFIIEKATDEDGKEYIDFFAGAGALNYGHNPDLMIQRVMAYLQEGGILHSMDMYTSTKREFLEYFQENILAPRGMEYKVQFAGPTGTNVNDVAVALYK